MSKIGRPPVLDVTKQREVCAMLACGCSLRAAASYVGCAPSTISRTSKLDPVFANFIRRAYMRRELKLLEKIRNAGETQWRASAWLLERFYPDRYGPRRLRGRPSPSHSLSSSSSSSSTGGEDSSADADAPGQDRFPEQFDDFDDIDFILGVMPPEGMPPPPPPSAEQVAAAQHRREELAKVAAKPQSMEDQIRTACLRDSADYPPESLGDMETPLPSPYSSTFSSTSPPSTSPPSTSLSPTIDRGHYDEGNPAQDEEAYACQRILTGHDEADSADLEEDVDDRILPPVPLQRTPEQQAAFDRHLALGGFVRAVFGILLFLALGAASATLRQGDRTQLAPQVVPGPLAIQDNHRPHNELAKQALAERVHHRTQLAPQVVLGGSPSRTTPLPGVRLFEQNRLTYPHRCSKSPADCWTASGPRPGTMARFT